MLPPKFKFLYSREQKVLRGLLRQLRIDAGLRQEDLAVRLGAYQTLITKIETGQRRLDLPELRAYVAALGLDLSAFVNLYDAALAQDKEELGH